MQTRNQNNQIPAPFTVKPAGRGIAPFRIYSEFDWRARDKQGQLQNEPIEFTRFALYPDERFEIFKRESFIFALITGRMNRIASSQFTVTPKSKVKDSVIEDARILHSVYKDFYPVGGRYRLAAVQIAHKIRQMIPTVLPDLSNLDNAINRYNRSFNKFARESSARFEDFFAKPNKRDTWEDFVKKYTCDLNLHGASGVYKERGPLGDLKAIHVLPGGSVFPVRYPYITQGNLDLYVQYVSGLEAQLMRSDEIAYDTYLPTSMSVYGMVPIDAVLTKVCEMIGQDQYWGERADGSVTPKNLIVFGDSSGMGGTQGGGGGFGDDDAQPLDAAEQRRIEESVNQVRKTGIRILSGVGRPMAVNLSNDSIAGDQLNRRMEIKKEIALAFSASNAEINETGGNATSGRATIDGQMEIDRSKGEFPILNSIQALMTNEILPLFRGGENFIFEFVDGVDETAEAKIAKVLADTGQFSTNEIRTEYLNRDPFPEPQYDRPTAQQPPQQPAIPML